ncbi:Uncharacterized protein TCAP_01046 [Tolypocladium capitatum]|uniref:HAUS augmin-like complex subunit 6 N-terminal domain-containing protein n=1 Tax=Tolypocladium capitatum TaxID=45235 RepID=A0A2K3QNB6_9HYPO|nr:Uncharacterized protein TCAP_01046 [Tolypocladium capitatum]
MAAVQHARTRPARVAANSSRPPQPHAASSRASTSTGTGTGTSGSAPIGVFLTNLRLLDLDLLPDWPGIAPETFATSGSGVQGQRRRVHCLEWALFHLFSLWDPDETANKLKPFFPPLDQMQSLNLRAALLRALEHAKKNGVLARDSAIRKTMLDECKGERLEEVLAYFSTAVLKKVVADDEGFYPAPAAALALENRGYGGGNAELGALVLAHRVSLQRILERKDVTRSRCRDFADLLSVKERSVARRIEVLRAREDDGGAETLSENAREEMRRMVRNNWSGNERWMQTLLLGDSGARASGLLGMPFDWVWRRVQQGRLAELEEDGGGLLEQLEGRVRVQRERLARWDAFRTEMLEHQVQLPPSKSRAQGEGKADNGIDLNFGGHQDLHVGGPATRTTGIGPREPPLMEEYGDLVDGLRDELAQIRSRGSMSTGFLARYRKRSLHDDDAASQISELEDEPEPEEVVPSQQPVAETFRERVEMARRLPVRPQLSRSEDSRQWSAENSSSPTAAREDYTAQHLLDPDMETLDPAGRRSLWNASPPASPSPQPWPARRATSPSKHPFADMQRAPSPTQHLADQILASMADASPSPTKRPKPRHTLSLAQRTRLSMARANNNPFVDGDEPEPQPEHESEPEPEPPATAEPTPPASVGSKAPAVEEAQGQDDLASRTRRSMAGFERAQQKAQLERRRSLRRSKAMPPPQQRREGSYFPRVEEEETAVLAEELMGQEEDMEAVFRSRPKIKASPLASPTRE